MKPEAVTQALDLIQILFGATNQSYSLHQTYLPAREILDNEGAVHALTMFLGGLIDSGQLVTHNGGIVSLRRGGQVEDKESNVHFSFYNYKERSDCYLTIRWDRTPEISVMMYLPTTYSRGSVDQTVLINEVIYGAG